MTHATGLLEGIGLTRLSISMHKSSEKCIEMSGLNLEPAHMTLEAHRSLRHRSVGAENGTNLRREMHPAKATPLIGRWRHIGQKRPP